MVTSIAKTNPTTVTKNRKRLPTESCLTVPLGQSVHSTFILLLIVILTSHFAHCMPHSDSQFLEAKLNVTEAAKVGPQQPLTSQRRHRRFLSLDSQMVDHNPLPMLYIGEIRLNDYPECESWLEPYRIQCQRQYELFLQSQITRRYQKYQQAQEKRKQTAIQEGRPVKPPKPFTYERNSEYIKHASCCGMWQARTCVIEAIERDRNHALKERICPRDLVQRFRQLPNDPGERADVLDYCSEYGDGSLICHQSSPAAHIHTNLLLSSACALSAAFVVLVAFPRLYLNS